MSQRLSIRDCIEPVIRVCGRSNVFSHSYDSYKHCVPCIIEAIRKP